MAAGTLPERVAHFVTHRSKTVHLLSAGLLLFCLGVLGWRARFSSDVLDLFPEKFDSVRVWKTSNREFAQGRSLTFALYDESKRSDLEDFATHFGEALRREPWVVRVMDRLPLEDEHALPQAQALFLPLLLNLPPEDFAGVVQTLQPAAVEEYLTKAYARLKAGSMKDEQYLALDPLGILAPALKQLGASNMDQSFSLTSPDGTLRLVQVVTAQADLGAKASQAMMAQVEDFRKRVLASYEGEAKPEVLVTGRTAFVGELSIKMHRDVIETLLISTALVSLVFYLGFRRVGPLLAIMHVLFLCCAVAVTLGALIFPELNMITIGLCSILIGLGVDFGMMLYAIFETARDRGEDFQQAVATALREQGRGVTFGALTSAAAFYCHTLSGCPGFVQLGALIAIGILFAGFGMMTIFFASIARTHRPRTSDPMRVAGAHFTRWVFAHYRAVWAGGGGLLALLTLYAVLPVGKLRFDADPRTLEPPGSAAGHALRLMSEKMPGFGEQLLVLLEEPDAQATYDGWAKLKAGWLPQVAEGKLKSVSMLAGALTLAPAHVQANAAALARGVDFARVRAQLAASLEEQGGQPLLPAGLAVLDGLAAVASGHPEALDWRRQLPAQSSWWFLLDQFFGHDPNITAGFVTPPEKIGSLAQKEGLKSLLDAHAGGAKFHISGWLYTLQDLVPWARGMLLELSAVILLFNVVLLSLLYRRVFPLLVLFLSLGLSVGALVASLKLFGIALNLFNVLAFPLVIGVGVDYGIYVVVAMRAREEVERSVANIIKPVLLSGLTAIAGFASLATADNPALRGLGAVSALGIAWCLVATFFFILPVYVWRREP